MRACITTAVVVWGLSLCVPALGDGPAGRLPESAAAEVALLLAESPAGGKVEVAAKGSFAVSGLRMPAAGGVKESAEALLARHGRIWSEDGTVSVVVEKVERSAYGTVVRAALRVGEVRVASGNVRLSFDRDGNLTRLASDVPGGLRVDGTFVLTAEQAAAAAERFVEEKGGGPAPEAGSAGRVYVALADGRLRPAWRCPFVTDDLVSSFVVTIDGETGEFLASERAGLVDQGGKR